MILTAKFFCEGILMRGSGSLLLCGLADVKTLSSQRIGVVVDLPVEVFAFACRKKVESCFLGFSIVPSAVEEWLFHGFGFVNLSDKHWISGSILQFNHVTSPKRASHSAKAVSQPSNGQDNLFNDGGHSLR